MEQELVIPLTQHAALRARQRGISNQVIAFLHDHAGRDLPAGSSCTKLTLSRRAAERLLRQGIAPELVARVAKLALVIESSGRIVTVTHLFRRRARSYRRPTLGAASARRV